MNLTDNYRLTACKKVGKIPTGLDAFVFRMVGRFKGRRGVLRRLLKDAALIDKRGRMLSVMNNSILKAQLAQLRTEMKRRPDKNTLLQAFALAQESVSRTLGYRPYIEQVAGALALYRGYIAEMQKVFLGIAMDLEPLHFRSQSRIDPHHREILQKRIFFQHFPRPAATAQKRIIHLCHDTERRRLNIRVMIQQKQGKRHPQTSRPKAGHIVIIARVDPMDSSRRISGNPSLQLRPRIPVAPTLRTPNIGAIQDSKTGLFSKIGQQIRKIHDQRVKIHKYLMQN